MGSEMCIRDSHDFHFDDDWYDLTDGLGYSLTLKEPATTDPSAYGDKDAWRPSTDAGGSPGYHDGGTPVP